MIASTSASVKTVSPNNHQIHWFTNYIIRPFFPPIPLAIALKLYGSVVNSCRYSLSLGIWLNPNIPFNILLNFYNIK